MSELSVSQVRRSFLGAQGLLGPRLRGGPAGVLRALGAVQLDTISVLARSHELVAYARLGPVGRAAVESAYWAQPARAFEYWAHAACLLPLELWPLFAFRRRRFRALDGAKYAALEPMKRELTRRLEGSGPMTSTDFGGARRGGPWWDWSEAKVAVELLLREGAVVCCQRRGWRRVYDLAERVVPRELLEAEFSDDECLVRLVACAGAHLGVATPADLADYFRLAHADVGRALRASGLARVRVRGWTEPAWADPAALSRLRSAKTRARHRSVLLSPFDSVVWDRARTERIFGFRYRLEAYVSRAKRVHGYFAMPLLAGGRLVGRVDPARSGTTLIARQISAEVSAAPALASALVEAAAWVGCTSVALERVDPPDLRRPLRDELRDLGA